VETGAGVKKKRGVKKSARRQVRRKNPTAVKVVTRDVATLADAKHLARGMNRHAKKSGATVKYFGVTAGGRPVVVSKEVKKNPAAGGAFKAIKKATGWLKAKAVRVRRVNGRTVVDVKR
jgi:hypothetical protein